MVECAGRAAGSMQRWLMGPAHGDCVKMSKSSRWPHEEEKTVMMLSSEMSARSDASAELFAHHLSVGSFGGAPSGFYAGSGPSSCLERG